MTNELALSLSLSLTHTHTPILVCRPTQTHASDAWIVGETATDLNHDSLRGLDYLDEVRDREGGQQSQDTYPNVVFSAPPSGSENYLEEVERAVNKWDGTGTLLFTSSAAVYDLEQGPCTEGKI